MSKHAKRNLKRMLAWAALAAAVACVSLLSFQFFRTCYGKQCLEGYRHADTYRIHGIACFTEGGLYFPSEHERYANLAQRYFGIQYMILGDRLMVYSKNDDRYVVLHWRTYHKTRLFDKGSFCSEDVEFRLN